MQISQWLGADNINTISKVNGNHYNLKSVFITPKDFAISFKLTILKIVLFRFWDIEISFFCLWSSFDPVESIGVGQECQGEPNLGVWSLNWGDMETLLAPPIVNTYVPGGRGCKSMSIACSITTSNSALSQAGWHPLILMGTRAMVSNLPLLIYKELYCKKSEQWFDFPSTIAGSASEVKLGSHPRCSLKW